MAQSRRKFIKSSATLAALAGSGSLSQLGTFGQPGSQGQPGSHGQLSPLGQIAQPDPRAGDMAPLKMTNGIQIGADSFADEGTENVLDILEEKGAVNTLYLSTFTYDRGITGRPGPGRNYPGHGVEASDKNYFHGGNYATPHAQYYTRTAIKGEKLKAPDLGSLDILAEVLPKAKKRGMKVICSIQDGFNYPDDLGFVKDFAEIDLQGRKGGAMCFFQPDVREFWKSVAVDLCSSYPIDGVMLFNERNGPLLNAIGVSHAQGIDAAKVTCFCSWHEKAAKAHGIDFDRAKEGYRKLNQYVQNSLNNQRPSDGYYVEFERLLLNYPEIMAYNQLFDTGKQQILKDLYTAVKSIRKELEVGFHIEHTNSFNPLYRASRDYAELATMADFLKVVVYNNCGGERYVSFIDNICQTVFKDVPPAELMKMNNHLLNYSNEAPIEELAAAGLSADYVMRETQRAKAGVAAAVAIAGSEAAGVMGAGVPATGVMGAGVPATGVAGTAVAGTAGVAPRCRILPGIDINIPTGEKSRKASPEDTYAATLSAFKGGADGVILSRKYSEMRLENLAAAGRAIRESI